MLRIIPILIAVFLIYLGVKHFRKLPSDQKKPFIVKWLVYLTIALLILAFVTGRIHWLGALAAGLLGVLKFGASHFIRFLPILRFLQSKRSFGNPVFRTANLEIHVDLNSGAMSGRVISGEFEGKDLSTLEKTELDSLEAKLKENDKRSYYLLRVYRQRTSTSQGGDGSASSNYQSVSDPSIEECRLMLGLPETFTQKEVDRAYKSLMQKLHPDRGGNDYLASRINRARDMLINYLKNQT